MLCSHPTADTSYRFALGGVPFTVQILLCDKIVGTVYNFSATPYSPSGSTACENCLRQERAKSLSSGQVTLTGALLACTEAADSGLTTLQKDDVEPYLKANLRWRVHTVRRLPLALYLKDPDWLTFILSIGWGYHSPTVGDPVVESFRGVRCS